MPASLEAVKSSLLDTTYSLWMIMVFITNTAVCSQNLKFKPLGYLTDTDPAIQKNECPLNICNVNMWVLYVISCLQTLWTYLVDR